MVETSMLVRPPAVPRGALRRWLSRPRPVPGEKPVLPDLAAFAETTAHLDRLLAAIAAARRARRN
jgi:hypothetical protein